MSLSLEKKDESSLVLEREKRDLEAAETGFGGAGAGGALIKKGAKVSFYFFFNLH